MYKMINRNAYEIIEGDIKRNKEKDKISIQHFTKSTLLVKPSAYNVIIIQLGCSCVV